VRDAEDLVQEAMARASARWGRLRDYDVPEAWVRRVAMNLAADLSLDPPFRFWGWAAERLMVSAERCECVMWW
jgi:hypothetical protein